MQIKFSKYEGLGNDFIIVDRPDIDAQLSRTLCDRRRGIGADGVLVITPTDGEADYEMVVWNADGSIAEMCGNGLRCVGQISERSPPGANYTFLIQTGAGRLRVQTNVDDVVADVGGATDLGEHRVVVGAHHFVGRWLSTGNPHFVLYGQWRPEEKDVYGPLMEGHELFRMAPISLSLKSSKTGLSN